MINPINKSILKKNMLKFLIYVLVLIAIIFLISELASRFGFFVTIKPYLDEIYTILTYSIALTGGIEISLLSIISFSFIVFVGINLARFYKKFINKIKRKRKNISHTTMTILSNVGYYVIITIVVLTSLKTIGIDLSSFTMIISALSVGIGFGLQTIVSNFISGIILMFEQSIKEGDFIEIGDNLMGTVTSINMRSTTIRTNSNINIVVPNQSFIENNIINRTYNDDIVKLKIPFGVSYGTPFEKVEDVILKALEKSELNYIKDDENRKVTIIMNGMGSSSVDFFLHVWVKGGEINTPLIAKGSYLKLIYKTLNENNISIPFPQTDLHIKDSVPLEINIKK